MRSFQTLILGLLSVLLLPACAGAVGNIHIGQLKINPFLSLSETLSDNIYSTVASTVPSKDAKKDSITTTTPGLRLSLPIGIHKTEMEYYSVLTRYRTYQGEDTTDQHAYGAVDLNFGSLASLKLSDRYAKSHEPRGTSSTGFIEVFQNNTALASATYKLGNLSKVQIDYASTIWRFDTSEFRDRAEGLVSGYFYYRFLPMTSAFIEYDRQIVAYSQNTPGLDNTADSVHLGLTWEISARSKGTIKGGTIKKDFKSPDKPDLKNWTYSADVRHELTANTSIQVAGQRTVYETTLTGNRYVITTGVFTELTHRFFRKLFGVVRGSYGQDRFSDAISPSSTIRADDTTMGGAGIKYQPKDWLGFALDYSSRSRRSNLPENDYVEHTGVVTANMSF